MDIFNIDKLSLFVIFFIPGFISIRVWSLIVPSESKKSSDYLLEAISYSCLNFAIIGWSIKLIYNAEFTKKYQIFVYLYTIVILLILPVIYPLILNFLLKSKFVNRYFLNPVGKSWDHFFGLRQSCYIIIHTKDKKLVGGLYSNKSYASSYPFSEDIYIQEVWQIDGSGRFINKIPDTKGLWISKENISYIEFFGGSSE